jgi:thioredoxin-like negative regulator of GroEL
MEKITLDDIKNIIETKDGVLLYFTGKNCNVCHSLKPKIASMFEQKFPKIEQYFFDAHEDRDISAHFGVFSVPTILVFLGGREFAREGRAVSLLALEERLSRPYSLLFED